MTRFKNKIGKIWYNIRNIFKKKPEPKFYHPFPGHDCTVFYDYSNYKYTLSHSITIKTTGKVLCEQLYIYMRFNEGYIELDCFDGVLGYGEM